MIFAGTEGFQKIVGSVSLYMAMSMKQILFGAQLYIYWTIFRISKESDNKVKKSITKAALRKRYRLHTITLTGQIARFICDTLLTLLVFGFVMISNFLGMENYHVILLANICNGIQAIILFFSCPQVTSKYFGDYEKWVPKFLLKMMEPESLS